MPDESLGAALEREHHEIDAGLAAFADALQGGTVTPEPLLGSAQALRRHIYLEEEMLFPPLRDAGLVAPVFVMLQEHGQIWRELDRLERAAVEGTDNTEMASACTELAALLDSHNMKEERVLYPRADDILGSASQELLAFLESGSMPEGWVCARAAA
ncbi:MAG: hemerythrin domain-containing protein [Hyphomicrobiales bacterium]